MNAVPPDLIAGYHRFRSNRYQEQADRYAALADSQSPATMIIACADSRVDPATIFDAAPGELFVVRNVANLVPPCSDTATGHHGTSAALEFAVTGLGVRRIVVLGHGGCGGVAAALAKAENKSVGPFITPWVDLLAEARDRVIANESDSRTKSHQTSLEHEGIRQSLANLATFPFVASALKDGRLELHGAWFSIADGLLHWLDERNGTFETINP